MDINYRYNSIAIIIIYIIKFHLIFLQICEICKFANFHVIFISSIEHFQTGAGCFLIFLRSFDYVNVNSNISVSSDRKTYYGASKWDNRR